MSKSASKNDQEVVSYRALEDCRVGGLFRRKGDVFSLPETALSFLERVSSCSEEKPATTSRHSVTKEDLGLGKPMPSANITSSDMIKK